MMARRAVTIPTIDLLAELAELQGNPERPSQAMFDAALASLVAFGKAFPKSVRHAREGIHRLRQLDWMVERVWTLSAEVGGSYHFGMGKDVRVIELITLSESAYYIAFRLKGVINGIGEREDIPALKSKRFNPIGVRDVRNHLLEHTEEPMYVFATGGNHGPRLKPLDKYRGAKFVDRGLYVNIEEFLQDLVKQADAALGRSALPRVME